MAIGGTAFAQAEDDADTPVLITADEVDFDRERGFVVARGNVEVSQGARVLTTDELTYDQNTRIVAAIGNVKLVEPTGEIIRADRMRLTDDFSEGVIENFRLLFEDDTRLNADRAERREDRHTELDRAVFSPCALCTDDPDEAPLWQIEARKVVHDQETRDVEYYDAVLEMFGFPVAYTPYLTHPDPTVKRRSGLLAPTYGSDTQLGFLVSLPYFITLGPDKDLTVEPIITTKERAALAAEYRQRIENGEFDIEGSVTRVRRRDDAGNRISGDVTRGHIFAEADYDISRHWRTGFDGGWTTDDTYMRRYGISSIDTITSTAFLQGFDDRDFADLRGYHFQGLRAEDDFDTTPIVAPFGTYSAVGEPLPGWGRWSFDSSVLGITRLRGTDSRRLAATAGWQLPHTTDWGLAMTFSASLLGAFYWVNDANSTINPEPQGFNGTIARLFPQAVADFRYPVVRELGNVRHIIEPRVSFIAAPNTSNPSEIPNEDSQDFEFDDTNLFSPNRFPGIDRLTGGQHVAYGISSSFFSNSGGKTSLFLGQNYRLQDDSTFDPGSGLEDRFSDYVGRISLQPSDYLWFVYRFRLDKDNFNPRRSELSTTFGPPWLRAHISYLFFEGTRISDEFGEREEVAGSLSFQVTDYWSVFGHGRFDLTDDGGALSQGVGFRYEDECFAFTADYTRSFTRDRDFEATDRVLVQAIFKHLGQIGSPGTAGVLSKDRPKGLFSQSRTGAC